MEFGEALGGHDRSELEKYLEVVYQEAVDRKGGPTAVGNLLIGYFVIVRM
jgi:hypothetical protein